MQLEIRKSKTRNAFNLLFSISALAFYLYWILAEPMALENRFFIWLPGMFLTIISICFGLEYRDKAPLYLLTEEGMFLKQKNIFLSWAEIQDYQVDYINERYVGLEVLLLHGQNHQVLTTLVLTGTDYNLVQVKQYIQEKLFGNNIPILVENT